MINKLIISNFKSHNNTNLRIANLTMLTGLNGMGKSSVVQAILLLRQTRQKGMITHGLELKGDLCDIGIAKDALYQSAENDLITFEIETHAGGQYCYQYYVDDTKLTDTFLKINSTERDLHGSEDDLSIFTNNFQYVSAYRNGPSNSYEKDTSQVEIFRQISRKEGRCEYSAHYLDYFGTETISDPTLSYENDMNHELHYNVQRWMDAISPGIQIDVESLENSYRFNYRFSRGKGKTPTDAFKATNIGFGISYVLPIVVAVLHAPKGSLIIIENPEAHIHPAGQAKLMELICRAACAGVQIIIETHSDHIINGMLVSVKEHLIENNMISLYYFDRKSESHETISSELPVLEGGRIKKPPKGFFDQIDIDMKTLMGF